MKLNITRRTQCALGLFAILYCASLNAMDTFIFRTTKKQSIAYTVAGSGKALVLIHAFPTNKRLWESQLVGLQKHFRVITIDLWGFGQSSPVDGKAITMTEYADEVKQLLDQLHIQQAIIGGESMGGYIALAFLQKYPEQVSGLVLSNTQAIADTEETKIKREATAVSVLQNGMTQLIDGFMPKALTKNASVETRANLRNILLSATPTAAASALRGMSMREDLSDVLAKSALPILIITSEQDEVISPLQSQQMHALAKNSTLVTIANAAHLSNLEQPLAWNQAVINQFAKN